MTKSVTNSHDQPVGMVLNIIMTADQRVQVGYDRCVDSVTRLGNTLENWPNLATLCVDDVIAWCGHVVFEASDTRVKG